MTDRGNPGPTDAGSNDRANPYVGPRPFEEAERHLFYGRDRDARRLTDTIVSAPFSILYAQSGLGKTSLLRTRVIPKLREEEDCRVFFFDNWRDERPEENLKELLSATCRELGLPEPSTAPTLSQYLSVMAMADDLTPVLILDQFEEFLFEHEKRLDPLRRELALLVNNEQNNARVLLAMREEALAMLEPFRSSVLDLFQSTYRLDHLSADDIRKAIVEPARQFGVTFEPALVEQMLDDMSGKLVAKSRPGARSARKGLRATGGHRSKEPSSVGENKPDRSDKTPSNIELPILQLVCSELWKRSVDENTNTLRLQNYQTIGGADQILGDFVHDVMPKQWHQQLLTARLMGRLAPPSGFKSSYAVADIADAEPELAKDDIEAELDRLEGRRILKARPSAAGKRYELQHDAFIKVIRPWRASVLAEHEKQASRRRIIFRSLGALAVVSAASYFPITGWIAEQKVYETTEGALTDLEGRNEETNDAEREVVIDNVASFMLRRESYQDFRSLMKKYVHLIPPYYGSNTTLGLDFIKLPEFGWPYVLQYSEDRPLNSWHFALEWRRQAQFAAEDWGLPFPSNFYLDRSPVLSSRELHVHSDEADSILLQDIRSYEDFGIIYSQTHLPDTGKTIVAQFVDEWKEVPSFVVEEPWLAVPRWSLPMWKNIGHPAGDGSGLTAVLLAERFFDHPEFLLTPEVTRMLLDHLSDQYPATVDEARSARGDRLSEDLVEIVRRGIPLTNLPFILETIALLPDADSIATADQVESIYYGFSNGYDVVSDLRGSWATDLDSGTKPHLSDADIGAVHEERRAGAGGSLDDESGEDDQPIDDVQTEALALFDAASHTRIDPVRQSFLTIAPWLNLTREPIRVFAGDALYDAWTIDGRLTPELVEAAESVKDDVFRASGIELSGPIFSPASGTYTPLEPWQFRLEFLGDQLFWVDPFETAAETAVEDFSEAFAYQIEENRAYVSMLDMEYVGVIIDLLPEPLSQWLYRHYSLSDLTILLRTVAGKPASQSENSIRFLPWLLGSLPFWSTQIDLLDQNEVVDRLQRTQRARVERAPASGATEDGRIVDGIQALNDGRIADAVRLFRPATMENANASEAAFLKSYVNDFNRLMDEEIGLACGDISSVFLDRSLRLLLENSVASTENETQVGSRRHHELCLLAAYNPTSQPSRFAYRKGALLTQLDEVADWRANDLVDFAEILIRTTDITGNHHQDRDRISEMMRHALLKFKKHADAADAFSRVFAACIDRNLGKWCWTFGDDLAQTAPRSGISFNFANWLTTRERPEDMHQALSQVEKAEENLEADAELSLEDRQWRQEWLTWVRAFALYTLGDPQSLEASATGFRSLLNADYVAFDAYSGLADVLLVQDKLDEADTVIEDMVHRWPNEGFALSSKLRSVLLRGDKAAVADIGAHLSSQFSHEPDLMFLGSVAQIISQSSVDNRLAREFLVSDHPNAPYVTILLYAFAEGSLKTDALRRVERRWENFAESHLDIVEREERWRTRLAWGDDDVWREMLIGHALGQVERDVLFAPLQNEESFTTSPFRSLTFKRESMLCEAHFYEGMVARANGKVEASRKALESTIEAGCHHYLEPNIARFLLISE